MVFTGTTEQPAVEQGDNCRHARPVKMKGLSQHKNILRMQYSKAKVKLF